ncbi:RsmE family RNA methyltransferase [Paraeggerthella hongkongensis]|uniref:Ribosomal RNA small subunit methyltransferase E n=1 Tax=Paraeggerthella hongkongensis TaxID=230658 RepID=A0A3N0BJB6_9ACTN|nr:RsmE family RNA methyltransferase [Paraeggerthella hongkongensis]RNL48368.1 RNA methyltransferase [Paraeggerthella hongkongensis]
MSLPHFYLHDQVIADEPGQEFPLRLAPDDAKHARVLRLAPGEHVAVVDAAQDYFECEIVSFEDQIPVVCVARRFDDGASGPSVVLVQGLAKGDKMETVIRHATELGVSAFVPLACERSIVKLDAKKGAAKAERWRAVAKSAAMQSGQRSMPEVNEPMALAEACSLVKNATAVLVCWEEAPQTASLSDAISNGLARNGMLAGDARIAVVVGPEGGLTQREVDALLECNPSAALVTLGPSILRTETAGIVAPALVLYELRRMADARRRGLEDARPAAFDLDLDAEGDSRASGPTMPIADALGEGVRKGSGFARLPRKGLA